MPLNASETPLLVIDLDTVERKYRRLAAAMPEAHHHYAIKANPAPGVLTRLRDCGGYFEVASVNEIDMCLSAGITPERILYGNPLKKATEIAEAHARGITQYVFDNIVELEKIAAHAPGTKVICRIMTTGDGAVSPLSIKFGCPPAMAEEWLRTAPALGLVPYGISFHTGSQQLEPSAWERPIQEAAKVFARLSAEGIALKILNVGGGFPVTYRTPVPEIEAYAEAIQSYVARWFPQDKPLIYTEPGRYMTGDAGTLHAEVVLVSPSYQNDGIRWVYLDVGRYGGLVEEKIDYPIVSDKGGETGRVVLAGQTCDSNDVIYTESFGYELPLSLAPGDRVQLMNCGAYTTTYATTLNGFQPLRTMTV